MILKEAYSGGGRLALMIALAGALSAPTLGALRHGRENDAAIRCEAPAQSGTSLVFSCNFTNKTAETLYLLTTGPILEGPGKNHADYLFLAPGGKRFENVLQYHELKEKSLDFPILFHPTIHLRLRDLRHLRAVKSLETVEVEILWELHASDHPGRGTWMARVKLLYIPASNASQLLRHAHLAPTCKNAISGALQGAKRDENVALVAQQAGKERGYAYDGCRDVISEAFHYLFSNTVPFKLAAE